MPRLRHTLLPLLLLAATHAHAADCDKRVLPKNDTLSAEAAARIATEGKLPDLHVSEACIVGTTTSVTLISNQRWTMTCTRLQSTWAKRGGWACSTPQLRPD